VSSAEVTAQLRALYLPCAMKLRHKLVFAIAAVLILLFALGVSPRGQEFLLGNRSPSETLSEADDRAMGAALAPLVYCLVPGIVIFLYGLGDVIVCRVLRRRLSRTSKRNLA